MVTEMATAGATVTVTVSTSTSTSVSVSKKKAELFRGQTKSEFVYYREVLNSLAHFRVPTSPGEILCPGGPHLIACPVRGPMVRSGPSGPLQPPPAQAGRAGCAGTRGPLSAGWGMGAPALPRVPSSPFPLPVPRWRSVWQLVRVTPNGCVGTTEDLERCIVGWVESYVFDANMTRGGCVVGTNRMGP